MAYCGKIIRSLFLPDPGQTLVGADLDSVEARVTGHFTIPYDGGAYAKELLEGNPHKKTAKTLGISDDDGKTINYAVLYGCGPKRVQSILGCSYGRAKGIIDTYWESHPALYTLKGDLERSLESRGFKLDGDLMRQRAYLLVFGRHVYVRARNALLNTLIQSASAIIMKRWYVLVGKRLPKDCRIVLCMHDEILVSCPPEQVEQVEKVIHQALLDTQDHYQLKIPLTTSAEVGPNYAAVH